MSIVPLGRRVVGVALSPAQVIEVLVPDRPTEPREFGRDLDRSGIDFVLLSTGPGEHFDASIAATILGRHTTSIGLVVEAAPLRDHPYNLARRLGSLDHLTHGRAGWAIGSVAARSEWTRADGDDVLTDAVEVARKLWQSWPSDTIVADSGAGVFAESHRIVHIDHDGAHRVAGPLNLPEPPQSHVPVLWISESSTTRAARVADVVIGSAPARAGQRVLAPWRIGTPVAASRADGILVSGEGSAAHVIEAAAAQVDSPRPLRSTATLRDRLGLAPLTRVLDDERRSAFPRLP